MLDLTKQKRYYELKWFDGDVLQFPMPKQELLMRMVKLENLDDIETQFSMLTEIITEVLNSNINKRVFTKEEINDLDLNTINLILEDYMGSINQALGE
jgi:hypothetical protein